MSENKKYKIIYWGYVKGTANTLTDARRKAKRSIKSDGPKVASIWKLVENVR